MDIAKCKFRESNQQLNALRNRSGNCSLNSVQLSGNDFHPSGSWTTAYTQAAVVVFALWVIQYNLYRLVLVFWSHSFKIVETRLAQICKMAQMTLERWGEIFIVALNEQLLHHGKYGWNYVKVWQLSAIIWFAK